MLEKACMAVEEAAKGGGVYPEVLFEVAHQWYWLYEQSVGGGAGQQREGVGRCGANGGAGRRPPDSHCGLLDGGGVMGESPGVTAVTATVTAAAVVPVISVGSTIYQSHALPGQAMAHPHGPGLHPYTTIQAHLPTVCTPQYLGHPLQQVPRPTVYPVPGAAYPQVGLAVCLSLRPSTVHYSTLQFTTVCYSTVCYSMLPPGGPRCMSRSPSVHLQYTTVCYSTLLYVTVHYCTLQYTILLHYTTVRYSTLLCYSTLFYVIVQYSMLQYTTLCYSTLFYVTVHYST